MTPAFEVPGDPRAILGRAGDLRTRGASFVTVADGLDAIRTDGWVSRSADMFRQQFDPEAGRWRDAGTGFVTAAGALEVYAGQLQSAQAAAATARTEWARGEQVTTTAKAAYDADVARGQREKAAYEAQGGTYTLTILPFHDPGESIRAGAQQAYDEAKTTLDGHAHTCADQVRAGCAGGPKKRNWFETGLAFVGDVFVGIWEGVEGLADLVMLPMTMLNEMLTDLSKLATGELTAEELAMKYQLKAEDAQALLTAVRDHPGEVAKAVGKAILDWDTWSDDPAKAIGHLVPDVLIAIATLGGAAAASGAEKGATGLAKGAEAAEDVLTATSKMGELADAAKFGDSMSLDDFATQPWSSSRGVLSAQENAAADRFLQGAADAEPQITANMRRIVDDVGGRLSGEDFRLKDTESFKGKFAELLDEGKANGKSADELLAEMKDSVRYTYTFDKGDYLTGVRDARVALSDAGYTEAKWKPSWGEPGDYKGINSFWRTPDSAGTFEIQLHTPESFDAKMATHDLYDQTKGLPDGPEKDALMAQQAEIFSNVPLPDGVPQPSAPPAYGLAATVGAGAYVAESVHRLDDYLARYPR